MDKNDRKLPGFAFDELLALSTLDQLVNQSLGDTSTNRSPWWIPCSEVRSLPRLGTPCLVYTNIYAENNSNVGK